MLTHWSFICLALIYRYYLYDDNYQTSKTAVIGLGYHDDIMTWKCFPHHRPFVKGIILKREKVDSLWPSVLCRHRYGSTLALVMMKQCWLTVVSQVLWYSSEDIIRKSEDTNQWNKVKNWNFKIRSRSDWDQWVYNERNWFGNPNPWFSGCFHLAKFYINRTSLVHVNLLPSGWQLLHQWRYFPIEPHNKLSVSIIHGCGPIFNKNSAANWWIIDSALLSCCKLALERYYSEQELSCMYII